MRQPSLLRILVVAAGLVAAPSIILGQQQSLVESRRDEVIRALKSISELFGNDISSSGRGAIESLLALAAKPVMGGAQPTAATAAGPSAGVPIPIPTVRAFQQDEAALQRRKDPSVKAPDVNKAVENDLTTKDAAYKNSPMGLATMVTVEVHTRLAGGAETNGWQVMVIPAPLALFAQAPGEPFGLFSSPTSRALPPGPYFVWGVDPADSRVKGPIKPITLGSVAGGAVPPMPVDIQVPKSLR